MQTLENTFNFTLEDLAANEAGTSSPRQRRLLLTRYTKRILHFLVGVFGFFSLMALLFTLLRPPGTGNIIQAFSNIMINCFLPMLGLGSLMAAYNLIHVYLSSTMIKSTCGLATIEIEPRQNDELTYYLHIASDDERYTLTEAQSKVVKTGEYYCVYALPIGTQILSIKAVPRIDDNPFDESVVVAMPSADTHKIRILNETFGFTEKDLYENESGNLSPAQHRMLFMKPSNNLLKFMVAASILLVMFTGIGLIANYGNERPLFGDFEYVILLGLLFMIPGCTGLLLNWLHAQHDIQEGQVKKLCGQIRTGTYTNLIGNKNFALWIESHRFILLGKEISLLEDGGHYCIYYAPQSKVIVAIQAVQ